jgi:hypothetical protein
MEPQQAGSALTAHQESYWRPTSINMDDEDDDSITLIDTNRHYGSEFVKRDTHDLGHEESIKPGVGAFDGCFCLSLVSKYM